MIEVVISTLNYMILLLGIVGCSILAGLSIKVFLNRMILTSVEILFYTYFLMMAIGFTGYVTYRLVSWEAL